MNRIDHVSGLHTPSIHTDDGIRSEVEDFIRELENNHSQNMVEAEEMIDKTSQPIKYRITGQISKYQGQSYMLLRKALIVYDMGNLGK